MKYIVLCLSVLWMPQWAHADRLRVTSYDMDDTGGTVRLESDAAIGEPWLRIEGRTVRVWFPHVVDVARFDHERSNEDPIHALALRPGSSETAVLRIELGAARRIGKDDITVSRQGTQAAIALRVASLRPAPEAAAAARAPSQTQAAAKPAAAQAAAKNARPALQLTAAEAPATAPHAAAEAGAITELAAAKTAPAKAAPLPLLAAKTQDPAAGNSFVLLGIATFLLGAVYLGLQLWNKRRPQLPRPQIEVLGTRRLGHRQELMIVRALGSDHLLLCTGGRAERVASTPTPLALPADLEPERDVPIAMADSSQPASQAGGIGLISRLSSQHRLRKLLDAVEQETAEPEREQDREHTGTFGAELVSAARDKTRRPSLHSLHAMPQPGPRQSDAVAGITRLRRRAATQH